MATKVTIKTTFEAAKTIEPIYTGGDISSDSSGNLLATCVEEDVLVVDVDSGNAICRIEGDGESVTSLCLAPNGSHLTICSRSLSLRIFSLIPVANNSNLSAHLLKSVKAHNSPVVTSAIDETGSILATGCADGTIKVWDIRGCYVSHTFHGHSGIVSAVCFFKFGEKRSSGDAKAVVANGKQSRNSNSDDSSVSKGQVYLASGGEDGKIRIWDLYKRKSIAVLDSHTSVVRALQFSSQKNLLLSASRDRTIILWSSDTWKPRRIVPALEVLESGGFLVDGKYCYTGGEQGVLRIWDSESGKELVQKQSQGHENDSIVSIVHKQDINVLISARRDQTLKFHSYEGLRHLRSDMLLETLPVIRTLSGNHDEIIDMACVGYDRSLLALATNTEAVKLISIGGDADQTYMHGTGKRQGPGFGADVAILEGHSDIIICMDVDWSGCWLATGAKDNSARLWRLDSESLKFECVASFLGHAESVGAIALPRTPPAGTSTMSKALSQAPEFLITGSQDKTVKRWDISKTTSKLTGSDLPLTGMKAVYTRVAHEKDINAIDVSPTAPLFASASQDRTIKVWSLDDGSVTGILRGHKRGVWSVRFSPAGTQSINLADGGSTKSRGLLVSGSGDRTVKVWSVSNYTCLFTFEGHSNSVLKVIWLSAPEQSQSEDPVPSRETRNNQALIASASSDTLVKIWSPYTTTDSDHLLATLDNHSDRVWALASLPDLPHNSNKNNKNQPTKSFQSSPYALISGAADATLTFWRDTTTQTASTAAQKVSERIEQDQMLQNHIHAKNYEAVITLALALNHPGRLLKVFEDVVNLPQSQIDEGSITGLRAVDDVLCSLSQDQLFALLERVRDWNTNARTAPVAQRVLHCLLKGYDAETFLDMARNRRFNTAGKGVKDLFRALEVYTDRHYRRNEDLVDESYLLEYTLREMDEVAGTAGAMDWDGDGDVNGLDGRGLWGDGDVKMIETE